MPCLGPLTGYWSKVVNPSGKRSLVFKKEDALTGVPVNVPCGQCIGCRLQRSLDWAVRLTHETKSHEVSSFVTLTYSDDNLPRDGSLHHRDFQLFMKRLRKKSEFKFKYYMCGEYGDNTNRPHYHALLFGVDFNDRMFYRRTKNGDRLDTSQLLDDTWQLGHCIVGNVTFESCAYVARYVTKKIVGDMAADHYMGRTPEYAFGSNGLGRDWIGKYADQSYAHDFVVIDGRKCKLPRYYDVQFEKVDAKRLDVVKKLRVRKARLRPDDLKNRRSWTREKVIKARLSQRGRDYES